MPNFPDHQRTGALAEQDVMRLFTEWSWNAGKDQIDSGYDLCVGPDHAKYKGARFMVQVKGTAKSKAKGSITAPVAKARLRQYAESVLPVFIVRVTADGGMYWEHAQAWARFNTNRLSGSGESGVKIDKANDLHNREKFEAYLAVAFAASPTLGKPVSDLEREVNFLNSLDPKLGVMIRETERGREHEFHGKQEPFNGRFSFNPLQDEANIANLRDAIEYGLPREIQVENFRMSGSPVFDHVPNGIGKGTLSLRKTEQKNARIRLYPGKRYSITASMLALDAGIYSGSSGVAFSNEEMDSVFNLSLKFGIPKSEGKANITMGLRQEKLFGRPIREFDELRVLSDWVDQIIVQKALFVEMEIQNTRERPSMTAGDDSFEEMLPLLRWLRAVGRLHMASKVLNSDFVIHESLSLMDADLADIDLAYALLKGDKRRVFPGEIVVETDATVDQVIDKNLYCTTTLAIEIQGQRLGEIPVLIDLNGFHIEKVAESGNMKISAKEGSEAWIAFDDNTDARKGLMRRKTKIVDSSEVIDA